MKNRRDEPLLRPKFQRERKILFNSPPERLDMHHVRANNNLPLHFATRYESCLGKFICAYASRMDKDYDWADNEMVGCSCPTALAAYIGCEGR